MSNKESKKEISIRAVGRTPKEADLVALGLLRSGGLPEGAVVKKIVERRAKE